MGLANSIVQNIGQKQEQKQIPSAVQQQSLNILQKTSYELEQFLEQSLGGNVFLEESPDFAEDAVDSYAETAPEPEKSGDDEYDAVSQLMTGDDWLEKLPLPPESGAAGDPVDFLAFEAAPGPTLSEQLASELATCGISSGRIRFLAGELISQLDERGYLTTPLADLAMSCNADLAELEEALALVQSFDPPGIGARSLEECLKLQLVRQGRLTPELEKLLTFHLPDIAANRLPALARSLNVDIETLKADLEIIRSLNPVPGSAGRNAESVPVEMEIYRDADGALQVRLLREHRRRVVLSRKYLQLLEEPDLDAETREYLKEKLSAAQELLKALALRESTLLRLGKELVCTQKDYFESGEEYLHPLTMRQTAEKLELHESTISRAVSEKYVASPQGVKPLKFFFSGGYSDEDGQDLSAVAVKARIRNLIENEDPRNPMSDNRLAELLKQSGLAVARRTVAKYREAMGIAPASGRKQF